MGLSSLSNGYIPPSTYLLPLPTRIFDQIIQMKIPLPNPLQHPSPYYSKYQKAMWDQCFPGRAEWVGSRLHAEYERRNREAEDSQLPGPSVSKKTKWSFKVVKRVARRFGRV